MTRASSRSLKHEKHISSLRCFKCVFEKHYMDQAGRLKRNTETPFLRHIMGKFSFAFDLHTTRIDDLNFYLLPPRTRVSCFGSLFRQLRQTLNGNTGVCFQHVLYVFLDLFGFALALQNRRRKEKIRLKRISNPISEVTSLLRRRPALI